MTFRSDLDIREANLRAVLRWLSHIPSIEVVLVEQDCAPRVKAQTLPANCKYYFARNRGAFNKAWGLNVGFKQSSGTVIALGDADLITDAATLMLCYGKCQSEFEAMKPYDRLIDLTREESQPVLDGACSIAANRNGQPRNREAIREFVCFCGGLFLIRRDDYEELGGFDERFLGWGGEDDAMTAKLSRLAKRRGVVRNRTAYHLWHERNRNSRYFHPYYQQNRARTKWYATCDTQSLMLLCQQDRRTMGQPDRYCHAGATQPARQDPSRDC